MAHIFRPKSADGTTNVLTESGTGWFPSKKYSKEIVNEFVDPAYNLKAFFNSLPSPFARMEIFRQAFDFVSAGGNQRQGRHENVKDKDDRSMYTFHHFLVSHCLDVLELLFHFSAVKEGDFQGKNKISIVKWTLLNGIENLKGHNREGRKLLGQTLDIYKKTAERLNHYANGNGARDAKVNNLFFILKDKEVIAATSPLTLVFTAPNTMKPIKISGSNYNLFIQPGENEPPTPLHKRDPNFQVYLHALRRVYPSFDLNFPELNKYIEQSGKFWAYSLKDEIGAAEEMTLAEFEAKYDRIKTLDETTMSMSGVSFGQIGEQQIFDEIEKDSDFTINSRSDFKTVYPEERTPLVLRNNFDESWKYTGKNTIWDQDFAITDAHLESEINERTLPGISYRYPFLTASDLLEDKLVRVRYEMDGTHFLTIKPSGNLPTNSNFSYLLPIKPIYFKYFKPEDLQNQLEIKHFGEEVRVRLTIPLLRQSNGLTLEMRYEQDHIVEADFALSIFPSYKTGQKEFDNFHRLMVTYFGLQIEPTFYQFKSSPFNRQNKHLFSTITDSVSIYNRSKPTRLNVGSTYYAVDDADFDFIQMAFENSQTKGTALLIPKWKKTALDDKNQFSAALDFGTTNTHIAYRLNNGAGESFFINKEDGLLLSLRKARAPKSNESEYQVQLDVMSPLREAGSRQLLEHEFLPPIISPKETLKDSRCAKFPTPTVLALATELNPNDKGASDLSLLYNANIDFLYNKTSPPKNIEHVPNLKWLSATETHKNYTRLFLKELLLLVRAKAILNKCSPRNVELIWFYPLSMSKGQQKGLQKIWNKLYASLFNTKNKTVKINESEAPYHWQMSDKNIFSNTRVLSIDIGGGTTDVVLIEDEKMVWGTSFLFGANSIFSNGTPKQRQGVRNGAVMYFSQKFEAGKYSDYKAIYEAYKSNKTTTSEELNNFFFSVPEFDYPEKLSSQENPFKLGILIHFTGIIYHTARIAYQQFLQAKKGAELLKKQNLTAEERLVLEKIKRKYIPEFICFSGNGSGLVSIVNNGPTIDKGDPITKLAAKIYNAVFDLQVKKVKTIKFSLPTAGSKEVTCLGGLLKTDFDKEDFSPTTLLGVSDKKEQKELKYKALTDEIYQEVLAEVKQFITIVREIKDLEDDFLVDANDRYFDCFTNEEQMMGYLTMGVKYRLKELSIKPEKQVDHSLFFYPLIGGIFDMNQEIFENLNA